MILPFVGLYNPIIVLPVVDFPQPDSPTRPNVFPSSIEKLTSFTAFKICFGLPQKERFTTKSLCRFLTSNKFIKIPPYSLWVQIHAPTNILHNDLYLIVSFLASTAYKFSLLLYSV